MPPPVDLAAEAEILCLQRASIGRSRTPNLAGRQGKDTRIVSSALFNQQPLT